MAERNTESPGGDPLLTVEEVAARLRLSQETVRRYIRGGKLRGVALGGRSAGYRIEDAELRRFLDEKRGGTLSPRRKQ